MPHPGRPRHRSPVGWRELRRRRDRLLDAVGRQVRELRLEGGVSQRALAASAGIDPAHLSRIERGLVVASLDVLTAVSASLGADLSLRLFPTAAPRLRDHLQAAMVEAIVRQLGPRWVATPELPVPIARGVIDLALRPRNGGIGVACEVQSQLRSLDLIQRRLAEKALRSRISTGTDQRRRDSSWCGPPPETGRSFARTRRHSARVSPRATWMR